MTAAGFLIFVLAVVYLNLFGSPLPFAYNRHDYIAASALALGLILIVAGVAAWLWGAMP